MGEPAAKGTVTPISSIFPAEEAQKASRHVHDAIADHQRELDSLHRFISDNSSLIELVHRLPDQLHHDVMVPFGKAAFFPGRLIHTNEFLVLLGEGYYAERTSKQTAEILTRRGKELESHADSLKAVMQDLKAEASFFDATAAEAAEGLVEIREDLSEENSSDMSKTDAQKLDFPLSRVDSKRADDEDEQYALMMSRLDELEKEELAAESVGRQYGDAEDDIDNGPSMSNKHSIAAESGRAEELSIQPQQQEEERRITEEKLDMSSQLNFKDLMAQPENKDLCMHGKLLANAVNKSSSSGKSFTVPQGKESTQAVSASSIEAPARTTTKPHFDSQKAFTGSIVERSHGIRTDLKEKGTASSQSSSSQPSKPVSRFKMQRR